MAFFDLLTAALAFARSGFGVAANRFVSFFLGYRDVLLAAQTEPRESLTESHVLFLAFGAVTPMVALATS